MKIPTLLKVNKVVTKDENGKVLLDKNGKEYRKISLQTSSTKIIVDSNGKEIPIRVTPRESAFIAYKESYLPSAKMEFGFDFVEGDQVAGDIVRRKVAPYNIIDAETGELKQEGLTIASVIVLGEDTSDNWENLVQAAFKNKGFELAPENKNPVIAVANQKNLVEA